MIWSSAGVNLGTAAGSTKSTYNSTAHKSNKQVGAHRLEAGSGFNPQADQNRR
eukprot:COSAG02_NODE_1438_length_12604_cov_27.849580_14_plen_53_part_00